MMLFPSTTLYAIVGAFSFLLYVVFRSGKRKSTLPLPPGPKGYPVIGNLLEFPGPKDLGWLVYDRWFKEYGDLVYFEVVGQPFLLVGSIKVANDLMERRSSNYSDRPQSVMLSDLMGWSYSLGLKPYGSIWRNARRQFHRHFNIHAARKFRDIHIKEARSLALRLLESPQNLMGHIRWSFASTIMSVSYGIPVESEDSEYIELAEIALDGISQAGIPGAFLVDFFPWMKHIPSWFPGAGWKRKAEYWYSINQIIRMRPFGIVKDQMAKGTAPPSVALELIRSLPAENDSSYSEWLDIAINVPAVAYSGGADTTVSSVQALFLALAMNHSIVKKAHEEIDRVIGVDRLPDFDDQPSLHYVKSIWKEILRWHNVTPAGVPHMASEADEYDGYFIPKGTIIIAAGWSILHNPELYEDPLTFNPDRFMKDGVFNPEVQ